MHIVIAGAGEVGVFLAKMLAREHMEIILMDKDPSRMTGLDEKYDLMTFVGSPTSIGDLSEINIDTVDLFIAVTPEESVNMTACMIASNLGAKRTLARINNYEYLLPDSKEFFKNLGVDHLIYPEQLAAEEIIDSIKTNWIRQNISFNNGALILLGIKVREQAPILNKKFNSGFFNQQHYRIVALHRKSETIIPKGDDEIENNDIVYFITTRDQLDFVKEQAGKISYKIDNLMIMGGSQIAKKTVELLPENFNTKILEINRDKCFALAEKLPNAMIIHCDGRNIELLEEEGIKDYDAFVAVTGNSEANILACLAAKRLGVKKTVAEVENFDYIKLAESMDIGTIINKKLIAASYIYQLTIQANVLNVRSLTTTKAEILELEAKKGSKITQSKIKDIKFPKNVNIGGIVRNGVGEIANGNTQIQPNDHVIVFCNTSSIRKIELLFS